ncbi:MAG: hypothetical protein QFB87_03135 [Patescibacteria group bacterium]|nr:hypothetical protein [Patescibacteria group bacterium]
MKKSHPKTGYKLTEKILLLVILALVIFVGVYIQRVTDQVNNLSEASSQVQPPRAATRTFPNGEARDGLLTVKQWGVSLPVSNTIATANYRFDPKSPNTIYLSTAKNETIHACAMQIAQALHGHEALSEQAIARYTLTDTVDYGVDTLAAASAASKYPDSFKKINSYVYQYSTGNGIDCAGTSNTKQAFFQAFKGLQPSK